YFSDPLMFTIMHDSVMVPSSHVVIHRSTIKFHLLSDIKDLFNRAPLAIDDVVSSMLIVITVRLSCLTRHQRQYEIWLRLTHLPPCNSRDRSVSQVPPDVSTLGHLCVFIIDI
ncbi:uncharacterized protein EDB91DRAFT_1064608, partial [Suillus paluster]|uniref:uncharacterized protein n=1 Tax=Suillus paluster TaxID=48578 RepID=UPI001B861B06